MIRTVEGKISSKRIEELLKTFVSASENKEENFYIEITNDSERRLGEYHVNREKDTNWLFEAVSEDEEREMEKHFTESAASGWKDVRISRWD